MTTTFLHNINPILISVGPLDFTYYGLAYALGILIGIELLKRVYKISALFKNETLLDDLVLYIVLGILVGGRLGYAIFYQPELLLGPQILYTWQGGMSFHGALIGIILAISYFTKKNHIRFWQFIDYVSIVGPIGLFLGRIANFINGELYGRLTNGKWGVIFPYGGSLPRHPSQLYEAIAEGLILFLILNFAYFKTKAINYPGRLSGLFLCGYGISRIILENFREPDPQIGYLFQFFTLGQLLTIPMILIGIFLILRAKKID